jgi:predicted outer membrane repeat protein
MHVLKMVAAALSLLAVNGITCAALASPSIEQCLEQADLPGCFIVVEGNDAWRTARSAWLEQHEQRLAEQDEGSQRGGSVCAVPELPRPISPRKTVGNGTPASCTERRLRRALSGGGTIAFSCGSSPVIIPIRSELVIANRTVLNGGGTITLDGQNRTRIIRNNSELTLKRITLARGRADVVWDGRPNGGGAVNTTYGKRLYVVDSIFVGNRASKQGFGGAIFQAGAGALTVVRSRFENNVGGGGGAIYSLLAELRVINSAFVRNRNSSGWHGGGGIMTDGASANSGSGGSGGAIRICGSRFRRNQALATGGGAYLYAYGRDTVRVTRSTFIGNSVVPNDGGVSMGGGLRLGASPALVTDTTFRNNTARTGGAIATNGARTRVQDSTFECNSSDIEGGNVLSEGNTMLGC